jgi:AraC-like DNA-binding protein
VKKYEIKNVYLITITLLLIWYLSEFLAIRNTYKVPINIFYGTRYGSWFLLGPLTYYFFKTVTNKEWKFGKLSLLHLLPFLIFTLLIPIISNESLSYRQIHYGMLAVFDYRPKTVTAFEYLYSTIFYIQFIHLGIYLLLNSKLVNSYSKRLKKEYSNINDLVWLKTFNVLLIAILVLVSAYLYILFSSDIYTRTLDYIYVVPIGLFIYAISYKLSNQKWLSVKQQDRYKSSNLKEDEKLKYINVLEKVIVEQQPYLQNDLRLKDLATLTAIKQHHLSQLINEHYNCSFFDFINQYRIDKAIEIMKSKPKTNLLQIAFDAGFNNKTSFVNAFKKFKGTTPSKFRNELNR